ncbi:hypothetical protein EJB05_38047, partial [Eragrostis curvula]
GGAETGRTACVSSASWLGTWGRNSPSIPWLEIILYSKQKRGIMARGSHHLSGGVQLAFSGHYIMIVDDATGAWFLLLVPLVFLLLRYSTRKQQSQQPGLLHLPPSPPALPILGHLHLVGSLPHVSLRSLAQKHGADLMLLRLGAMPAILVTSPHAAEAVLRTHDQVLASRPHSLATEIIMSGPCDIGFEPYGECWRQAKKLVITHLLNSNMVSMVMAKISEAAAAGAAVDMTARS